MLFFLLFFLLLLLLIFIYYYFLIPLLFYLIRSVVNAVFPTRIFNVVEDLVVDWHWVLSYNDTVYRINEKAKKVLHDRGVSILINI